MTNTEIQRLRTAIAGLPYTAGHADVRGEVELLDAHIKAHTVGIDDFCHVIEAIGKTAREAFRAAVTAL